MALPKLPSFQDELKEELAKKSQSSRKIMSKTDKSSRPKLPKLDLSFDNVVAEKPTPSENHDIDAFELEHFEEIDFQESNQKSAPASETMLSLDEAETIQDDSSEPMLKEKRELEEIEFSIERSRELDKESDEIKQLAPYKKDTLKEIIEAERGKGISNNDKELDIQLDSDEIDTEIESEFTENIEDEYGDAIIQTIKEEDDNEDEEDEEDEEENSKEDDYYLEEIDSIEEEFSVLPIINKSNEDFENQEDISDKALDKAEELDKKVQQFFANVKGKLFSKRSSKTGPKEKIEKGKKKEKSPKGKPIKPRSTRKKGPIIVKSIIALTVLGGIIFGVYSANKAYSPLESTTLTIKNESDIYLEFSKFNSIKEDIYFEILNKSDISANIVLNMKFKEKSLIPFIGKEFYCISDIIALDSGTQEKEAANCSGINNEKKYKLAIEVVELP